MNPILRAFEYYVEMGRKMEEEKQKTQEKQVKKFSPDYERKLDKEMQRKLSREFDKRLHQEIHKKFVEEKERKISGDFRNMHPSASGNNSRKTSFDNNRNENFHTPPGSNSPLPSHKHHVIEENTTDTENDTPTSKPSTHVYMALLNKNTNDKNGTANHKRSLEEKLPIANGQVCVDHGNT